MNASWAKFKDRNFSEKPKRVPALASSQKTLPKILLVANTAWYLYNFRMKLALSLREKGYEPVFVSPPGAYVDEIKKSGFRWIEFPLARAGMNPFQEFNTLATLHSVYRKERPQVVHHFTIKCVLYGTIAAFAARIPSTINAVTGIGHFLIGESRKAKLLRPVVTRVYRFLMRLPNVRIIFQNPDDQTVFQKLGIASIEQSFLIRSSGVNLARFTPVHRIGEVGQKPVVFFGGRLLSEKGIREFVSACSMLLQKGVAATFVVAGAQDPGNPSSISDAELENWKKIKDIQFIGHQDNMESVLAQTDMVVLPSYREGVPKILLEASAMEKAIVASDVPGCREAVQDGINGTLVPVRNAQALADAIEVLVHDHDLRKNMGKAGRNLVMTHFDDADVAKRTIQIYQSFSSASEEIDADQAAA